LIKIIKKMIQINKVGARLLKPSWNADKKKPTVKVISIKPENKAIMKYKVFILILYYKTGELTI
jgi:hypothetical protein